MSKQTVLLCLLAALSWSIVSAHVLVPPKGYSVGFIGIIRQGEQKYICDGDEWSKTGSSATLYGLNDKELASYRSVYDQNTGSITYFWDIINSAGGSYESGQSTSGLEASPVSSMNVNTSSIAEYLALVKAHRGLGDGEQVAYVSLTGTTGGLPPRQELCTTRGATSGVPFTGNFTFYTQDRQPPPVPADMTPPGMFIQTVFLEGKMAYRFEDDKWLYIGFFASMADVAGGNEVGKCGTVKGGQLRFLFSAPNESSFTGFKTRSLEASPEGCPWQLVKVTSSQGETSPFGEYDFVLIGATYGGNPPLTVSHSQGMVWSSPFTGQAYLYVK